MTEGLPANGYTDGDVDTNSTTERSLESMAAERYSRRQALFRGAGATTMAFMGTAVLAACGDDDGEGVAVTAGANAATSAGRVVTSPAARRTVTPGSTPPGRRPRVPMSN